MTREQIPLVRAFAITISKAQGQTLDCVLFDARYIGIGGWIRPIEDLHARVRKS